MADAGNEKEFMYASLLDYVNDELDPVQQKRFAQILTKSEFAGLDERYQEASGRLQTQLQSHYLNEGQLDELHSLLEAPEVRLTKEAQKIDQINRRETVAILFRRLVLGGLMFGFVGGLFYYLKPPRGASFDALQSLTYEAMVMEEDDDSRLDMPSQDLNEITEYFNRNPSLDFLPVVLKSMGPDWKPHGAAVIDYETAKASVVEYRLVSSGEHLFVFSYNGKVGDLKRSEPAHLDGFVYQTYATDQANVVVWQSAEHTVSMIVGHRSAPDLATLAKGQ